MAGSKNPVAWPGPPCARSACHQRELAPRLKLCSVPIPTDLFQALWSGTPETAYDRDEVFRGVFFLRIEGGIMYKGAGR